MVRNNSTRYVHPSNNIPLKGWKNPYLRPTTISQSRYVVLLIYSTYDVVTFSTYVNITLEYPTNAYPPSTSKNVYTIQVCQASKVPELRAGCTIEVYRGLLDIPQECMFTIRV